MAVKFHLGFILLIIVKLTLQQQVRPQYHYSVSKDWLNDPNGLVYLDGEYHMYYQYTPDQPNSGIKSWAHTVSEDLITWTDLPVAIEPDQLGDIWSGSAVVDFKNSSGFQESVDVAPIIAIFTHFGPLQQQSIAYSNDHGRTFTKYSGNPVIANPGQVDFRDPKVFQYGDKWILVLAAGNRVEFYESDDLKQWELLSDFGVNPDQGLKGVWECPDIFPLNYGNEELWVLLVSNGGGGPNGGSNTQYFVGTFNGSKFISSQMDPLWLDFGIDNYASVSFFNLSRRVIIGWMTNLMYASDIPTGDWRGQMTLPRELKLEANADGEPRLSVSIVEEIEQLHDSQQEFLFGEIGIVPDTIFRLTDLLTWNNSLMYLDISIDIGELADGASISICFLNGRFQEVCTGFDQGRERPLFLDRERSGRSDFNPNFSRRLSAERETLMNSDPSILRVQAFLDVVALEVFFDSGFNAMNCLFYPSEPFTYVEVRHHAMGNLNSRLSIAPNSNIVGLKSMNKL